MDIHMFIIAQKAFFIKRKIENNSSKKAKISFYGSN